MRCIYCLETTTGLEGEAHVFPEALKANYGCLPRGAVCNSCNNYLGDLDTTLVSHPLISLAIQVHAFPGKNRKPRDKVGNVDRTVVPYGITIPCAKPTPIYDSSGRQTGMNVRPLFAKTFDLSKFRRALHHVGLNLLAATQGVERALAPAYDDVRRYVRKPRKGEARPYAQYVISMDSIDKQMLGGHFESDEDEYIGIRLFQVAFFVNLLTKGDLARFCSQTQPPGTEIVDSGYKLPRLPAAGKAQYRITIVLDEEGEARHNAG